MISSVLFRYTIAILMLMRASAFSPPATAGQITRDVICHATNKRENSPFDNNNNIEGIGGLNMNIYKTKKITATATPKSKKNSTKKIISKPAKSKNTSKPIKSNNEGSEPTKTPWSSIILAFLTPWRNPNSIFLYLFLIVEVLGTLNATPK